ncbi:hypothetical protein LshimejAT787_1000080 [Lyophyllum shimeji]|uniref:Uncharacterized protein n=1 Tax=Lyophyllum shimeji TaxID=47721 RepID=A0A9P3UQ76_LYOSH|nr:hypothetical protein LshimejAT787_1000080 [Lyophyllum shimeji]
MSAEDVLDVGESWESTVMGCGARGLTWCEVLRAKDRSSYCQRIAGRGCAAHRCRKGCALEWHVACIYGMKFSC